MRQDASGWAVRWDEARAQALRATGAWPGRTMAEHAAELVARRPGHVIAVDGAERHTAKSIYEDARRLAGAFVARGLKPGDRISYQLPNWAEAIVIDLAATMAGLVVNPLVAIYREAEVGQMMEEIGSRMLFIPSEFRKHDYRAMAASLRGRLSMPVEIVVVRGDARPFTGYADLLASGDASAPMPSVRPEDVKLVLYTSGSSGRPKAVLHSHDTVGAMAELFRRRLEIGAHDVMLVASPVTHITGAILAFQLPWVTGARAVMLDVWDGSRAAELIKEEGVSITNGAAPFVVDLVAAARAAGDRLPSIRVFIAGGSAIPEALANAAYSELENCVLFRAYGATEVPAATMGRLDRAHIRLNTTTDGEPQDGVELRIVDPVTGVDLPRGSEGEIVMRGPQMMLGYLRPEDSAAAFDAQGYFRSGDLGRFVEGDWIEITGRAKDIIIRAGENLSPKEVEDALLEHPAVTAIAIVAKPSERTGEAACAFVIPAKPDAPPTIDDFAAFLTARGFARQKIPEHVVIVDALPMTAAGKVQKHVLRDWAKALP
jgi:acyl-CoA synthetase (AMP-forming)/AMP-acid ligase II